ncbi:MAG: OFA family MFS transporter [Sarcina sp.]
MVLRKGNLKMRRWFYVMVGIALMMLLGTVYCWSVFRIPIEKIYGIRTTLSGIPYMCSLVFYSGFVFFTGKYIKKYSPKIIMGLGGSFIGVGWLLSSYADNIYLLTLSYGVLIGSGVGIVYGVPISIISRWFPDKKGLSVGLVLLGFGLSTFVTAPIANYLIINIGIFKTFFVFGVFFVVTIPLFAMFMRFPTDEEVLEFAVESKESIAISPKEMIKTKTFKGLYLCFIFGTMIGLMIVGVTANIGVEMIRIQVVDLSIFMSIFAVFNAGGRVLFGMIIDKLGVKKAMLISYTLIILAAAFMIFFGEGNTIIYLISFSLFWLNLGAWLAIAPAGTLSLYGEKRYSENYGATFTGYGIGAVLGIQISGMLKDAFGNYLVIFYFIVMIAIIGIIVNLYFFKNNKK